MPRHEQDWLPLVCSRGWGSPLAEGHRLAHDLVERGHRCLLNGGHLLGFTWLAALACAGAGSGHRGLRWRAHDAAVRECDQAPVALGQERQPLRALRTLRALRILWILRILCILRILSLQKFITFNIFFDYIVNFDLFQGVKY